LSRLTTVEEQQEGNMEPVMEVKQDNPHGQLLGAANLLSAVLVTIVAFAATLRRWETYSWLEKGLCLILLLNLALPILTIAGKKSWDERLNAAAASDLYRGYIWLIIIMILFKAI
jgi:hypothetical protein